MPRVEELIIITEFSPWCTIIKNPNGVTLGDICTTLFKEYVFASCYLACLVPIVFRAGTRRRWSQRRSLTRCRLVCRSKSVDMHLLQQVLAGSSTTLHRLPQPSSVESVSRSQSDSQIAIVKPLVT